jgi:hypothetical protein
MCSVCPASACIGAKVEAGSYPASFAGDCGESKLPCWRNRPTCRWRLALEEEKRKETGQRVRKGWIEKTGEEMREKELIRKRGRKARGKGRKQRRREREGQVIPFTPSALQTSPAMRWEETQEGEGDAAIWIFLRIFRPHKVPHLAKTTPGHSKSASQSCSRHLGWLPARCERAHMGCYCISGKSFAANNSRTCRVCRAARTAERCILDTAPLQDAALRRVLLPAPGCSAPPCDAKPCVRLEMGWLQHLARVRCVAACSTACCISQKCCSYLARPAVCVSVCVSE